MCETATQEPNEEGIYRESVEWVAESANKVAAFQLDCVDALVGQGTSLLNLLLAGAGGALAFAVKLADADASYWQQGGMWGASIWLFFTAAIVLSKVLWSGPAYGPANDPGNLVAAFKMPKERALRYDIAHRQAAIEANRERYLGVSHALNLCRALAIATPLAFFVGAAIAYFAYLCRGVAC